MKKTSVYSIAFSLLFVATSVGYGHAQENKEQDRLLIVNGNTGRVIYDDGKNDLFCVTRRTIVGYHDDGRPIFRRTMRCR